MRKITYRLVRVLGFVLLATALFALSPAPAPAQVAVGISVDIAPPELPVYDQPICPGDDYIWAPGYWAWDQDAGDYYWVPGTWVFAPVPGYFWTPGYWAWGGSGFVFTAGYWGPVVGFYGGINYGFGYFGHGYEGGRWERGHFFYNREVSNVNITIVHNTYESRVRETNVTRVSFNGGNGGINTRPTRQEEEASRARHVPEVAQQMQHAQEARGNRELRASVNHGAPPVAATVRPNEFRGGGVVATREAGAIHERPGDGAARPMNNAGRVNPVIHPHELPAMERPASPNTGNAKLDRKYQQQQDKVLAQQARENQKLQLQQEKEHQKLEKQRANDTGRQQMEQTHQRQTQQLQQAHTHQIEQLQQRQQPKPPSGGHPGGKPHPGNG